MKILHLADEHARRENWYEVLKSMDIARKTAEEQGVDLIVSSGDFWDGPVQNTAGAKFTGFVDMMSRLANAAPIVIIYGTPSHDTDGSLEIFESVQARHAITILRPGVAYFLTDAGTIDNLAIPGVEIMTGKQKALLFGVPEPNKKWLLAEAGAIGKAEADQRARDELRKLFLGLGGIRKQYPSLPCILLYHGQVLGARTGTGYTAGSGLAVSRDDLAAVGADYIALGDIHEPQQIPGIPAYYPGSIYPGNWGETHVAGCNMVTIEEYPGYKDAFRGDKPDSYTAIVARIEFNHPQRVKICLEAARRTDTGKIEYAGVLPTAGKGRCAWLEITAPKALIPGIDKDALLVHLLACGFAVGSRVTVTAPATETVRAGEITQARTLFDKFQVWGESSGTKLTVAVAQKVNALENEISREHPEAVGARFRTNRLLLRGARGIWKNQRRDEIDLDLDGFGPGVIALVGRNGAGKTTVIENMHPWPQMLTRDGKLRDHFRLRDSCRDLYFTDERTGTKYRALMNINAAIASGNVEYYLYKENGNGFEPLPGINGRLEPYEAAVAELFGSLEMYLRTAFVTQRPAKNSPDLADTTKGERKALFAELSGVDYLDRYRAEAKARADAMDNKVVELNAKIAAAADVDVVITNISDAIAEAAAEAKNQEAIATRARDHGEQVKKEIAVQKDEIKKAEAARESREKLVDQIAEAQKQSNACDVEILSYEAAAKTKPEVEKELRHYKDLEAEAGTINAEETKLARAYGTEVEEYRKAAAAIETQKEAIRSGIRILQKGIAETEKRVAVTESNLRQPVEDKCPTCGQTLPADKITELKRLREENEKRLEEFKASLQTDRLLLAQDESQLEALKVPAVPERKQNPGAARLREIEGEIAFIDRNALETIISKAAAAEIRIQETKKRQNEFTQKASELREAVAAIVILDDDEYASVLLAFSNMEKQLEDYRSEYTTAVSAAAGYRATAAANRQALAEAEARKRDRETAEAELAEIGTEIEDWRLIERATGPDGIQALELDALAPGIAAVANQLLADAYGTRYQLEFRTTRIGGAGSRKKQIETFEIYVTDSETGEEQEIGTLSGGEGVWIKNAIYAAFGVIRERNTGIKFLTCFIDEMDGALDPEARAKYFRMLEAAHNAAGRHQTIVITHSEAAQEMIQEKLNVEAV